MKVAVMLYSFARLLTTGEMTVVSAIDFIDGLGVDAVELSDRFVTDDQLVSIHEALVRTRMHVVAYRIDGAFASAGQVERALSARPVQNPPARQGGSGMRQGMALQ